MPFCIQIGPQRSLLGYGIEQQTKNGKKLVLSAAFRISLFRSIENAFWKYKGNKRNAK